MGVTDVQIRLSKLRSELALPRDLWLVTRIVAWAVVLPVLKSAVPLSKLARWMAKSGSGGARDPERERRIAKIVNWVHWPLVRADKGCLQRSLIKYRLLGEANAEPHLIIGVRRGSNAMLAHAWVSVDGELIGEPQSSTIPFTPVLVFAGDGTARSVETDRTGSTLPA